jgi:hypothetical protein
MPQVYGHDDVGVDVSVKQDGLGGGKMRNASNTCHVLTSTSQNLSNSNNSGLRGSTVYPFVVDLWNSTLKDTENGTATIDIVVTPINKTDSRGAIAESSGLKSALPAPPPRLPAPPRSPR